MITLSSCVVGAGGLEIYAEGCVAEQDLQEQAMEATPLATIQSWDSIGKSSTGHRSFGSVHIASGFYR